MSITVRQWASLAIVIAAVMVLSGEAVGAVPVAPTGQASSVSGASPFNYSQVASQVAAGSLPAFPNNLTHFVYIVRENHVFDDYLGDCATTINASCNGGANSPGANSWSDVPFLHQWGKQYSVFDNMYSSVDPYSAQAHAYLFSANSWGGSDSGTGCSNWAVEGTGSSTQWGNYNSSAVKSGACGYSPDSGSQSYDATGGSIFDRFLGPNVPQSTSTIPFASFGDIIWELSSPGCSVASTSGISGSLPENSVAVEHVTGCTNGWWQNTSSGSPDMPPTVNTATGIPQMLWECQYKCPGAPSPFLDQYVAYSFISYLKDYGLPTYSFIELFDDHPGSNCGSSQTQATCIQWNDASMNLIVQDIMNSTSAYKDNTVVAISEDDTQDGQNNPDHVNSGRRFPFVMVASHNVMKGKSGLVIHQTFNTSNVLAVMERVEMNVNPSVFTTGGISPNSNAFPMVQNDYLAEGDPLEPLWKCGQPGVPCNTGVSSGLTISSFTAQPSSISLGSTEYLNVTATGGSPPYTYAYTGLPTGCTSASTATYSCIPSATGTSTVTVTVTDSASATATQTATFTVTGSSLAVSSFTALPATIPLGGTIYLNATATGGTAPYSYLYSGLPTGCTSSSTATYTCVPGGAGSFTVTVTVTDSASNTASGTATFTVTSTSGLAISSFTALPATIPLGGTIYLNVTATGGTPPYTYAYTGLPSGCTSSSTATYTCVPTASGSGTVTVTVTDSASNSVTGTAPFTVAAPPVLTVSSFTALPGTIPPGGTTYLNVTATGGSPPYSYGYVGLPTGCSSSNTANLVCAPSAITGTFTVTVTVTDSTSATASKSVSFTVSAATPTLTTASLTPTSSVVSTGATATFYGQGLDQFGNAISSGLNYQWTLSPTTLGTVSPSSGTGNTTTFTGGTTAGATGRLTLSVTSGPNLVSKTASITLFGATATESKSSGTAPLSVSFAVTASGGVGSDTYLWSYGDGNTSTSATPTYTYTRAGTFTPQVTVTDSQGHSTVAVVPAITVTKSTTSAVTVGIAASPFNGTAPLTVNFRAVVVGGSGTYSTYTWNFGDNNAGTGGQTSHTYQGVGTYPVELTVTDSLGNVGYGFMNISVTQGSGSTTGGAQTPWIEYAAIGAAVILAIALVAVLATRKKRPGSSQEVQDWNSEPGQGVPYQSPPPGSAGTPPPGGPPYMEQ